MMGDSNQRVSAPKVDMFNVGYEPILDRNEPATQPGTALA
jgi:hypothetical protein